MFWSIGRGGRKVRINEQVIDYLENYLEITFVYFHEQPQVVEKYNYYLITYNNLKFRICRD